jgi:hypothetical protein
LETAADDPDSPIVYDAQTAEYQFAYGGNLLIISPESKRASLFTQIPHAEQERLAQLLSNIRTIDDAAS